MEGKSYIVDISMIYYFHSTPSRTFNFCCFSISVLPSLASIVPSNWPQLCCIIVYFKIWYQGYGIFLQKFLCNRFVCLETKTWTTFLFLPPKLLWQLYVDFYGLAVLLLPGRHLSFLPFLTSGLVRVALQLMDPKQKNLWLFFVPKNISNIHDCGSSKFLAGSDF